MDDEDIFDDVVVTFIKLQIESRINKIMKLKRQYVLYRKIPVGVVGAKVTGGNRLSSSGISSSSFEEVRNIRKLSCPQLPEITNEWVRAEQKR